VDAPSKADLETALAAVRAAHPDADVVRDGIAEAYCVTHPGERLVYLTAVRRGALAAGDAYTTWVVTLFGGEATQVESFISRACSTGDSP